MARAPKIDTLTDQAPDVTPEPITPATVTPWDDQGPADDPGPFPPGPITQAVEENTLAAPVDETMDAAAELGAALDRKARKVGAAMEDVAIAKAFRRLVDAIIAERHP